MGEYWEDIPTWKKPRPGGEVWIMSQTTPRARADYGCDGCNEQIPKGTRYVCVVMDTNDGIRGLASYRLHGECIHLSFWAGQKRPADRWMGHADHRKNARRQTRR